MPRCAHRRHEQLDAIADKDKGKDRFYDTGQRASVFVRNIVEQKDIQG